MNKRKAFTLIELLVVIAIIALLMAILIPALNVVREQARGMNCLANQRSLAMAYIMYANENDSRICGGYVAYDPVNGIPPWVKGPLKYSGPKMVALGEGEVTVEQRINGIKAGELYKYIGETKAYHCPGDRRYRQGTSVGIEYTIYRSYSLPNYMRATQPTDEKILMNFKFPGKKMLFVEDFYDGLIMNHNPSWAYEPRTHSLWDPLGLNHSDSCTFSFVDGHAALKKWTDKRTLIYFRSRLQAASLGFGRKEKFNPPNDDLYWLDEHYPGPSRYKQ